jgi:hypothetical protein
MPPAKRRKTKKGNALELMMQEQTAGERSTTVLPRGPGGRPATPILKELFILFENPEKGGKPFNRCVAWTAGCAKTLSHPLKKPRALAHAQDCPFLPRTLRDRVNVELAGTAPSALAQIATAAPEAAPALATTSTSTFSLDTQAPAPAGSDPALTPALASQAVASTK